MRDKGKVKVLIDKTYEEFGIDFLSLNEGSHAKIYVQCERCNEIILRERRLIKQSHNCPIHITKNNIELKWCDKCKQFLPYDHFDIDNTRYDGLSPRCKMNDNSIKFKNWLESFFLNLKKHCKVDDIDIDIDIDFLMNLWNNQNGKCYYSGISIYFDQELALLERLDPTKGYIKGNVVWVCEIIKMNFKTPIRLEYKLLDEKAKPPFRKRSTDAGYDISSIEDIIIKPHCSVDISTGIAIAAPSGYYFTVDGRSSMSRNGIIPFRGIIDSGYCGHLMVALSNISDKSYEIKCGDRIAQIILHKQYHADFNMVENFGFEYSQRGANGTDGFGSSGK